MLYIACIEAIIDKLTTDVWDVTPCIVLGRYQHFGGKYYLFRVKNDRRFLQNSGIFIPNYTVLQSIKPHLHIHSCRNLTCNRTEAYSTLHEPTGTLLRNV